MKRDLPNGQGERSSRAYGFSLCLKGEMARGISILIYYWLLYWWTIANGLAWWTGTLKKHNWKIDGKNCEGGVWIELSGWAQNVVIFLSCVHVYHRVILSEKSVSDQVDRMTCYVDTSKTLSTATPAIAQWVHEQRLHWRDGSQAWVQQQQLVVTKANLTTDTAECPNCQQQTPT